MKQALEELRDWVIRNNATIRGDYLGDAEVVIGPESIYSRFLIGGSDNEETLKNINEEISFLERKK